MRIILVRGEEILTIDPKIPIPQKKFTCTRGELSIFFSRKTPLNKKVPLFILSFFATRIVFFLHSKLLMIFQLISSSKNFSLNFLGKRCQKKDVFYKHFNLVSFLLFPHSFVQPIVERRNFGSESSLDQTPRTPLHSTPSSLRQIVSGKGYSHFTLLLHFN